MFLKLKISAFQLKSRMMAALKDVVATSNINLCFNLGQVIEWPALERQHRSRNAM